ncbi:unnamed protein product [Polarella glacialis]|uniref:Uncharacterized protein n=1 Tax=Polarella glacialis TaxID=89957 RepID=A0A813FYK8_POLGL|nr:unnamed protein product [Polarella glacialis]
MEAEEEVEAETAEEAAPAAQQVVEAEPVVAMEVDKAEHVEVVLAAAPAVMAGQVAMAARIAHFEDKPAAASSQQRGLGSSFSIMGHHGPGAPPPPPPPAGSHGGPAGHGVPPGQRAPAQDAASPTFGKKFLAGTTLCSDERPSFATDLPVDDQSPLSCDESFLGSFGSPFHEAVSPTPSFTPRCASPEAASSVLEHKYARPDTAAGVSSLALTAALALLAKTEADPQGDAPPSPPRYESLQRTRTPRGDIEQGGTPMSLRPGAALPRRSRWAILSVVVAAAAAAFAAHAAAGPLARHIHQVGQLSVGNANVPVEKKSDDLLLNFVGSSVSAAGQRALRSDVHRVLALRQSLRHPQWLDPLDDKIQDNSAGKLQSGEGQGSMGNKPVELPLTVEYDELKVKYAELKVKYAELEVKYAELKYAGNLAAFLQYAAQLHPDVPSGAYAMGGPLHPDGLVVEATSTLHDLMLIQRPLRST